MPSFLLRLSVFALLAAAPLAASARGKLNLSTAKVSDLKKLPGLSAAQRDAIARTRSSRGREFTSLSQVPQLDAQTISALGKHVKFSPANAKVARTFFVEGVGSGAGEGAFDLHLSEHGLDDPKLAKWLEAGKVSSRRFIEISEPVLRGGYGAGEIDLAGRPYSITYAWSGREHSFTVRIAPKDGAVDVKEVHALLDDIRRDEFGGVLEKRTTVSRADYFMRSWGIGDNRLSTLRRKLSKDNEGMGKLGDFFTAQTIAKLRYKRTVEETERAPMREVRPEELARLQGDHMSLEDKLMETMLAQRRERVARKIK